MISQFFIVLIKNYKLINLTLTKNSLTKLVLQPTVNHCAETKTLADSQQSTKLVLQPTVNHCAETKTLADSQLLLGTLGLQIT